MRGRKKRAKTDRTDARLLRDLLQAGELPASWIPPTVVLEWRERTRLYKSLIDQRSVWVQRIHAELYQHGVTLPEERIRSDATRQLLLSQAVRSPVHQPRRRLLPVGQATPRRQARRHLRGPQARPPQLPHPPATGTPGVVYAIPEPT